jgi:hypothetical protein
MLYFIDDEPSISEGLLEKHGLRSLLPQPMHRQFLGGGPGGKKGLVLCDDSRGQTPTFNPEGQRWVKRFGFPGTYVGIDNSSPPSPQMLAKETALPGVDVTLLDGQRWTIPLLRQWRESDEKILFDCQLPTVLERDQKTGRMVSGPVIHPLRSLWERSCEIADDLMDQMQGGQMRFDSDALDGFIGDLFSINYRLTLDEIGLLGLLDVSLYSDVLFAALDWHQLRALVGNLQRRLIRAGASEGSSGSSSKSGQTPSTEADSIPTAQP